MTKVLGFLALLAIDVPVVLLRGFVLSCLWLWFVVPLGVVPLGVVHAIGISIVVGFLTKNPMAVERDEGKPVLDSAAYRLFASTAMSLAAWGGGALIHSVM